MRRIFVVSGLVLLSLVGAAFLTLGLSELGEVVIVRSPDDAGEPVETRIWIVDASDDQAWIRAAAQKPWARRTRAADSIEIARDGVWRRYDVVEVPSEEARVRVNEAMRAKYGLADRLIELVYGGFSSAVVFRVTPRD